MSSEVFDRTKWILLALVPNVWLRPNNARKEADAKKAALTVPDGDHLTMMNVYNNYILFKSCSKSSIYEQYQSTIK